VPVLALRNDRHLSTYAEYEELPGVTTPIRGRLDGCDLDGLPGDLVRTLAAYLE
jgi:hypothetical protein